MRFSIPSGVVGHLQCHVRCSDDTHRIFGSPLIYRHSKRLWWSREKCFFLNLVQDLSARCIHECIFANLGVLSTWIIMTLSLEGSSCTLWTFYLPVLFLKESCMLPVICICSIAQSAQEVIWACIF